MDHKMVEAFLVFSGMVIGMGCFTAITITWLKWRRKPEVSSSDLTARLEEISARLSHIDGSVDTMAVEVERISEAQRFTARVLAERASTPALADKARPHGSTTPH